MDAAPGAATATDVAPAPAKNLPGARPAPGGTAAGAAAKPAGT